MDHYSCYWMTHNVQKGGDFLKSYSANCNQVASFHERTVKKDRVLWTSTRDGKIPSKLSGWHFLLRGCLSFTNCLRTSGWKVNETRFYGLFQGKFLGATEHLKRLSCFFFVFFFYWTECAKRKFVFHLVKSYLWVSFTPWDWFVWIFGQTVNGQLPM